MSEGHSAILYCPYCAEEDLRPHDNGGASHGAWLCVSCRRVFGVRMIGISPVEVSTRARAATSASPIGSLS
jgi:hypothetical protein